MNTKLLGRWGESVAAEYLKKLGYKITGVSYHTRFGEIDIIAENREFIVFAEVKLRKNTIFGDASEFVGAEKQRKLVLSASLYLQAHPTEKQPRFDVIGIIAPDGMQTAKPEINHIENAFGE